MAPHFVLFYIIFLSIYGGMHFYVLSRILGGLGLTGRVALIVELLFLCGGTSFIGAQILTHQYATFAHKPLYMFGMAWLGTLSIGLTMFIIADIARLIIRTPAFRRWSAIAAIGLTAILSAWAVFTAARAPQVREIAVRSPRVRAAQPVTIVQLTDMHINLMTSTDWLERVVRTANGLRPDIIVITGDLLDGNITKRPDLCALLRQLRAPYGVFAVSGNHEYYTGLAIFEDVARMAAFTIIDNQTVATACGIELVGISDQPARPPYLSTIQPSSSTLSALLSHQPDVFDEARAKGFSLQLSGHTHAGQIPPMSALIRLFYRYPYGLYRKDVAVLYTNPGTGWWGPPMRLFSRCTIAKIVVEPEK